MKYVFKPVCWLFFQAVFLVIGLIYTVLFFMWDPVGCIKEKRKNAVIYGDGSIYWKASLKRFDFWCPYINS